MKHELKKCDYQTELEDLVANFSLNVFSVCVYFHRIGKVENFSRYLLFVIKLKHNQTPGIFIQVIAFKNMIKNIVK